MKKDEIEKTVVKESPEEFANRVEEYVWMQDVTYYEAVVAIMESSDYDPEHVSKLITPALKAKMEKELKDLHLVRKKKKK